MQDNIQVEQMEEDSIIEPKKKGRTWLIAGGVLVLVAVLAGAAFVGGRLLNAPTQVSSGGDGPMIVTSKGGGARTFSKLDMEPAKELPTTSPDVNGLYQRRADSSIFIGTGKIQVMAQVSQGGAVSMTSNYDGPVVEVVVTHDTTIYRDVTMKQFDGPPPDGQKLQQVVEPGSIDEIGENSTVVVWGDKRGERIVARVLMYSLPAFMARPAAGSK
jgi:hypothetical protein